MAPVFFALSLTQEISILNPFDLPRTVVRAEGTVVVEYKLHFYEEQNGSDKSTLDMGFHRSSHSVQ